VVVSLELLKPRLPAPLQLPLPAVPDKGSGVDTDILESSGKLTFDL
jgi:hypothetical protein